MNAENDSCIKPAFWGSFVIDTLFSIISLVVLIMVYIRLRKIDQKISVHKAKRQLGLRAKNPRNTQEVGKESGSQKMPASQPEKVSLWLREQMQSQLKQHPNAQFNSCTPKGNGSEHSSLSGQHSDSDDVHYTTITFPIPKHGISTAGGYRD